MYGVGPDGRLAKPSEGGFGCRVEGGGTVGMWSALAYAKAEEVEGDKKKG